MSEDKATILSVGANIISNVVIHIGYDVVESVVDDFVGELKDASKIKTIGNASGGEIAGAGSEGGRNSELGNKLDFLFGKATESKHNIERSVAMENSLNRIGIYDNEYGREYLSSHLNQVLNDSSNISNIEVRSYIAKELPGCPEITYTAVTKESLLMGPYGVVKLESVWDGNRLLTVVIKGGN